MKWNYCVIKNRFHGRPYPFEGVDEGWVRGAGRWEERREGGLWLVYKMKI